MAESVDRDALIERALEGRLGVEEVKLWEQGAPEREHAEASLVEKLHGWHTRLETLEKGLAENTAATGRIEKNTAAIVEAFQSLQGAMNVLQTLGRVARPLSYIGMAVSAFVGLFYAVKGGTSGIKP